MGIFGNKCQKFFTQKTSTLNIKGLQAGIEEFNLGIGELTVSPKLAKIKEELYRLDLLQYTICQDIDKLAKNSPKREELINKSIDAKLRMLELAQSISSGTDGNKKKKTT